jgi:hypothetical protein
MGSSSMGGGFGDFGMSSKPSGGMGSSSMGGGFGDFSMSSNSGGGMGSSSMGGGFGDFGMSSNSGGGIGMGSLSIEEQMRQTQLEIERLQRQMGGGMMMGQSQNTPSAPPTTGNNVGINTNKVQKADISSAFDFM